MTIRVIVADDQDLIRTGLEMILNAQPGIEVIGAVAGGREAVAQSAASTGGWQPGRA